MKLQEIINFLEELAPPSLQESYDNSGLIVGNPQDEISGVLVCLDSTEAIIDEAIETFDALIVKVNDKSAESKKAHFKSITIELEEKGRALIEKINKLG